MTDGVLPRLAVRLEPETALRLAAVHDQVEAREHRLVEALHGVVTPKRRGVHERHGARPMPQEAGRERDVQRLVEIDGDDRRGPIAHDRLTQAPERTQGKLSLAFEFAQRHVAPDALLDREWPVETGERHIDAFVLESVREPHGLAFGAADTEVVDHEEHVGACPSMTDSVALGFFFSEVRCAAA